MMTRLVCPTLRVCLVGDGDTVLTLFVFKGCLPSCITKLPITTGHRKHYVLCFNTSHPLSIDLSALSLLREGGNNVAQPPSFGAGSRGTRCRAHTVEATSRARW